MLLIGADGGGTHTKLVLADESGCVLASSEGGAVNYNAIGLAAARANLFDAAESMLVSVGQTVAHCDCCCIGSAALDAPADAAQAAAFCGNRFDPDRCLMDSDAWVSLVAASEGRAGILMIAGTGAMGTASDGLGHRFTGGGWGYLLGDSGSGFDIGRRALLAAAEAEEGGPQTRLRARFLRRFGVDSIRSLIPLLYAPGFRPSDLAALAPEADAAASEGDPVAQDILRTAAASSAAVCAYLHAQTGAVDVFVYGGVFAHSARYLSEFRQALQNCGLAHLRISTPSLPPEAGALMEAARSCSVLSPQFLSNLKKHFEKT